MTDAQKKIRAIKEKGFGSNPPLKVKVSLPKKVSRIQPQNNKSEAS